MERQDREKPASVSGFDRLNPARKRKAIWFTTRNHHAQLLVI